jgi:hypothetical protein
MMGIMCTIGTLICYTPGSLLTVKTLCLILVVPSVAFFIAFDLFAYESPYFLLTAAKEEQARIDLKEIRKHFVEKETKR